MKRGLVVSLVFAAFGSSLWAQTPGGTPKWLDDFQSRFPPVGRNAAAEELERLALALGVEAGSDDSDAGDHPRKEDREAFGQAQFGSWLDAQLKAPDDSIAPAPPRLKEFLERRQPLVSRLVALLIREVPNWGFDVRRKQPEFPDSYLRLIMPVTRVLLSAALLEESAGRHQEAASFLEASWSLARSLAGQPLLSPQLISLAVAKLNFGVVRKMSQPSFEWLRRTTGDSLRDEFLEGFVGDRANVRLVSPEVTADPISESYHRGWIAVVERVRQVSPCDLSRLPAEEIWRPLVEEVEKDRDLDDDARAELNVIREMLIPNLTDPFRRLARVLIDRELTAKILELREEKAALRRGRWPERLSDLESRVCPRASYEYRARGLAMRIRFVGFVDEPDPSGLVLPLSFEAKPRPTPNSPPKTARPAAPPVRSWPLTLLPAPRRLSSFMAATVHSVWRWRQEGNR